MTHLRRTMKARVLVFVAAGVACAALALRAQQPTPAQTFRGGVELVAVDVSVLDKNRNPIEGLTAADFTVFEDGKPRPIEAFSAVVLPRSVMPSAPWMRDVAPDIATNVMPPEGRLVVIVTSGITPVLNLPMRKIADAVIDALGPGDVAAVVHTGGGTAQGFTSDHTLLKMAIDHPFLGIADDEPETSGQCLCNVCRLETLTHVADAVRDVPRRRKTLVFIGTSLPVETGTNQVCDGLIRPAREALFRAAHTANVTIDALDPSGLNTLAPTASAGGTPQVAPINGVAPPSPVMGEMKRQGTLGTYTDETGGRFVVNTNAPEDAVRPILRESSSYYILAFAPATPRSDGLYHDIDVKVNRPGVTLQVRRGYYAPGGKPSQMAKVSPDVPPALAQAMAATWPKTDLPLDIDVAPFLAPDRKHAVVTVVVHAQPPASTGAGASSHGGSVLAAAFTPLGDSADYERATMTVPARASDYEVLTRLTVKPGWYEVRASLDDGPVGGMGSVYSYLTVPDFASDGLHVSGAVLSAIPTGVSGPRNAFTDVLPVVPTARRAFARTDRVSAFVRLYSGGKGGIAPVRVSASIRDENDQRVFGQESVVSPERFTKARSADFLLDLPLASYAPGEYLLSMAFDQGKAHEARNVRFTMR